MSEPPAFETFRFAWKWQQALIGIAVGGALLAITAERAPLSAIAGSLRAMDAGWAGLALIAYAADLALRVIRWRLLFAKVAPLPVVTFARALLVGYGLNILLPARLGELARIEYLKLRTQTRRSTAIPAILVERAMDGFLVLGALLLGLLAARSAGAISPILVGLIGTSAGLVAILVVAPLALRRVPAFIAGRLPLRAAESLARAHGALAAMEPGILGGAGLMTLAIYIAEAAALAAMLKAVGAAPDPGLLLALLGAASLSTLLPTAPGFLGSYQLAFALVFELFGHPPALGAAAATAIQAVLFAPLVLVALVLALAPQRRRRAAPISTTERAGAQALWLEKLGEAGNFIRWVGDEIRPFVRGRVLEVGCGTGTYTELLAGLSEEVVAVDLDPSFAETARRRFAERPQVRVLEGDARRLPVLGKFDTIVMLDVLEHIEDDVGMLAELGGRLADGGRLVLKVPALPALYGTLDAAIGHYRRYSRRSLSQAAARAGLLVTDCRAFNLAAAPGWWLNGRVFRRTHPPEAQLRLYDRLVPAFRLIDRLTGPPAGTSLIAAAARADRS